MTTLPPQPPLSEDALAEVLSWVRGRTPDELGAIEVMDRDAVIPTTLFPEALRYRDARGKVVEVPVLLKVPYEDDLGQATKDAVQFVAQLHKGKKVETPDQARELVGVTRFENLDTAAVVALCARSVKPPHGREYLLPVLVRSFPPTTIQACFDRIAILRRLWDPNVAQLTEKQFWAFASEVARVRNLSPLAVLVPALQSAFIARLAVELMASRTSKPSSGSSASSTVDTSEPTTSD